MIQQIKQYSNEQNKCRSFWFICDREGRCYAFNMQISVNTLQLVEDST